VAHLHDNFSMMCATTFKTIMSFSGIPDELQNDFGKSVVMSYSDYFD